MDSDYELHTHAHMHILASKNLPLKGEICFVYGWALVISITITLSSLLFAYISCWENKIH